MATAGDLVFGGTVDGYFFAIDAVSGEELWHVAVGARVQAAAAATRSLLPRPIVSFRPYV